MDIHSWTLIWKVCLIGTLGVFSIMAVVVSIGGAYDVLHLLKSLRGEKNTDGENNEST